MRELTLLMILIVGGHTAMMRAQAAPPVPLADTLAFLKEKTLTNVVTTQTHTYDWASQGTHTREVVTVTHHLDSFEVNPNTCTIEQKQTISAKFDNSASGTSAFANTSWSESRKISWSLKSIDVDHLELKQADGCEETCNINADDTSRGQASNTDVDAPQWRLIVPFVANTATSTITARVGDRSGGPAVGAPFSPANTVLWFETQSMATRAQKALVHAIVLCGGAKLEPF